MDPTKPDGTGTSATTGQGGADGAGTAPPPASDQSKKSANTGGEPSMMAQAAAAAAAEDKTKGSEGSKPAPGETGKSDNAPFEVKLPDGVKADEQTLQWYTGAAKEAGLSSDQASKLAAGFVEQQAKAGQAAVDSWAEQGKKWSEELKADKDFGGAKLTDNLAAIGTAIKKFPEAEQFWKDLDQWGLGNLPSASKFLAALGRAVREDNTAGRAGASAPALSQKELDDLDYPSSAHLRRA